ncbi:putative tricarboxylic transport membrane protein [Humitalea rosea]|uniref:Putative tricarboxylic transport membrane protein n=1 Tax=Humitalea rosea TaxID=990373 RepID=A0A2W7IES8_9PROT|nr:tripartite tricarboxylate transporter TctB family protein [Humitalea rosea]PZW44993.1 putative tricarboxylic transport membrane protein [Humitalea rosea]
MTLRPSARADLGAAVFVLGLGILAMWQAMVVPASPLYGQVGPSFVPYLVAVLMLALGVGLCLAALRGGWSHTLEDMQNPAPTNWRALGLLFAGLLANLALIEWLGFVIAATAQFVLVAAAFGSRRPLRDLLIGAAVCIAAFMMFDRLLGVNIGAGILEGVL